MLSTKERENRSLGKAFTMNKYVLRTHHSVEDFQGYDPHEWTDEKVVETFEEAVLLIADTMWWGGDPFTLVSFEILCGEETVLRTGDMSPGLFFEARKRLEDQRVRSIEEPADLIEDDDMPF